VRFTLTTIAHLTEILIAGVTITVNPTVFGGPGAVNAYAVQIILGTAVLGTSTVVATSSSTFTSDAGTITHTTVIVS
jgi:hypothetical protein